MKNDEKLNVESNKICPQCKSKIDKDAKICPNCRCAQWSKKDKKLLKNVLKTFGIIFLVLFVIIIVLAVNSPSVEEECANAKFVNLEEVYDLHAKDVPKAEELYKGKYFKFNGTISHKYKNYMQIQSDYISADVYFNSDYKDNAFSYNVDDNITYCGKINFGLSVQVKNSIILKED